MPWLPCSGFWSISDFPLTSLESASKAALAAVDEVERGVQIIGNVIEQHQHLIGQLHQQISRLQLEVDTKRKLEQTIAQLRQQVQEMSGVTEVLKSQNCSLPGLVCAVKVKERSGGSGLEEELKQLRKALANKEQAYAKLHKACLAIAAAYQKIYAKTHKIQA